MFSLPLIFAGTLLRTKGWPRARVMILILLAAIGGRVVAMGLNRIIDAEIDARNPRTRRRELAEGAMRHLEAWAIVVAAGLLYVISAAAIAPVCLMLSPIPVALFVLYPYLKRFTSLCHLGLGVAWSMGPLAGWIAGARSMEGLGKIGWLWMFSVLWVTGFDIIYATMDEAFDRSAGLHSLPVQVGRRRALQISAVLHGLAFLALTELWRHRLTSLSAILWLGTIGVLLALEHGIAERYPEVAFFHTNALIGVMVLGAVYAGI